MDLTWPIGCSLPSSALDQHHAVELSAMMGCSISVLSSVIATCDYWVLKVWPL